MVTCPETGCNRPIRTRGLCNTHYEYLRRRRRFRGVPVPGQDSDSRYESKVDRSGGLDSCHPWVASVNAAGYGNFRADGKMQLAHRWAFQRSSGPLDSSVVVRHTCDNPPCQNLRHLLPGSTKDNTQDMIDRGRAPDTRGERNGRAKLSRSQVDQIRSSAAPLRELAAFYGVSGQLISAVRLGRVWRDNA